MKTAVKAGPAKAGLGLVVATAFAVAALEGYDIQAFGVAAPHLAPDLGLNAAQLGLAASAAMAGLVLGAFAGGWAADRTGRKPVLIVSIVAFAVFSLATAFAPDQGLLLAARFLTGLGFGGAMPNLIALAVEISPPGRRAATTSAMFCGMPAGGSAVALFARYSGPELDWRSLFVVGGILPLLIVPAVIALLPETRPTHAPGSDRRLAPALFAEGRAVPTLLLWAVNVLTLIVLYLMLNWLPTLVVAKGLTPADGATASLAFNIVGVAGALILGLAVDRLGTRWTLVPAYLGLAAAMAALEAATGLAAVLALSAAAGFLVLGAQYALYALAPRLYGPQVRAAGAGAAVGVGRFGSIVGPLLAGELRQAGWPAGQVLGALAPVALAAAAAILALTFLARLGED